MLVYPLDPSEKNKAGQRLEWPFIGLALSFPTSDLARTVEYRVNNVYWEQEFEGA
jgi:hypothetical protein